MIASIYNWLLLFHIVASMVWVGGAIFLGVLATAVIRSEKPAWISRFTAGLRQIGPRLLAPATFTVFGFGIWMVLDSAAWGFDQLWVQLALGLFALAFVIGAAGLSRLALGAGQAIEAGDTKEALRQLRRWSWCYRWVILILLLATWDMVFKPGL